MAKVVPACKFVGTISLGLLTGISYQTGLICFSAAQGSDNVIESSTSLFASDSEIQRLRNRTESHMLYLTVLGTGALSVASFLSPTYRRHPYLVYAVSTALIPLVYPALSNLLNGRTTDFSTMPANSKAANQCAEQRPPRQRTTPETSDEEWEVETSGIRATHLQSDKQQEENVLHIASNMDDEQPKKIQVAEQVRTWRRQIIKSGVCWSIAWVITVVGMWGEAS